MFGKEVTAFLFVVFVARDRKQRNAGTTAGETGRHAAMLRVSGLAHGNY